MIFPIKQLVIGREIMGLLDKFRKKNTRTDEEAKGTRKNISTFSNEWINYFQITTGDFNYSIRYDVALDHLNDDIRKQYPHILEISVPYLKTTENGLPDLETEFVRLNEIEDSLVNVCEPINYIARITGGNVSRFIFCYDGFENESDLEALTLMIMGGLDLKAYSYKVIRNDNFVYYDEWIAPNVYEKQQMKNQQVCMQLEQFGEAFKTLRDVDFLFIFDSETYVEKTKSALVEQGFREVRCEKMEDDKFHLELVLEAVPEINYMDEWTNWILELLEDTDGYFDGWGCPVYTN